MDLARTRKTIISIAAAAVLLMLAGPGRAADVKPPIPPPAKPGAPSSVVPASPTGTIDVKFEKTQGLLSVKAEKADLVTLLKKVSEATGVVIEVGSGVWGTVSGTRPQPRPGSGPANEHFATMGYEGMAGALKLEPACIFAS
jgi:hypothetical protein